MLAAVSGLFFSENASACTGISLKAKDGSGVIARTMEWGGFVMDSRYVIIPRGYQQTSMLPTKVEGMKFVAKYGYAGIAVLKDNLIAEAMNEKGLIGELFYFPGYGRYEDYNPANRAQTLTDADFLAWVLGNFATVADLEKELPNVHLAPYGQGFDTVHFRIADATGRQVVIEMLDGKFRVFENKIGIITNAPSFDWQMTNLNNYVNLFAGSAGAQQVTEGVELKPFGAGSGALGLPGDLTPPSRFVRAAFYTHTAVPQATAYGSVMQAFQILNNFDLPLGAEFRNSETTPDMLSATQWTTACDIANLKFYYRTPWNSTIRCIDIKQIDFARVKFQQGELDRVKEQPVEYIKVF